jgi:hypothetical protein
LPLQHRSMPTVPRRGPLHHLPSRARSPDWSPTGGARFRRRRGHLARQTAGTRHALPDLQPHSRLWREGRSGCSSEMPGTAAEAGPRGAGDRSLR